MDTDHKTPLIFSPLCSAQLAMIKFIIRALSNSSVTSRQSSKTRMSLAHKVLQLDHPATPCWFFSFRLTGDYHRWEIYGYFIVWRCRRAAQDGVRCHRVEVEYKGKWWGHNVAGTEVRDCQTDLLVHFVTAPWNRLFIF